MTKNKSGASNYLCMAPIFSSCVSSGKQQSASDAARSRLSFSFQERRQQPAAAEEQSNSESIIDPAASVIARKEKQKDGGKHCTVIVGTIFGRRAGRVTFCVQRDAAVPPPFLFELSVPMQSLATEMGSGLLRIALECHRTGTGGTGGGQSRRNVWKASCNGRDVGHAVRRRPTEWDRRVLESMRTMTTGVGALPPAVALEAGPNGDGNTEQDGAGAGAGEVLYMRATYERVVGSRDAVSYHLISPGGTGGGSPPQELSVFLQRTRG